MKGDGGALSGNALVSRDWCERDSTAVLVSDTTFQQNATSHSEAALKLVILQGLTEMRLRWCIEKGCTAEMHCTSTRQYSSVQNADIALAQLFSVATPSD